MTNIALRGAGPRDSEFAYATKKAAFKEYVDKALGWVEDEQRRLHEQRFAAQDFTVVTLEDTAVGIMAVVVTPDCVTVNQIFLLRSIRDASSAGGA